MNSATRVLFDERNRLSGRLHVFEDMCADLQRSLEKSSVTAIEYQREILVLEDAYKTLAGDDMPAYVGEPEKQ